MKTVIISGGSLNYEFAASFLKKEKVDCLLAADKGMKLCYESGIRPDYVMGDFDSSSDSIVDYYRNMDGVQLIEFQPEKDDTDTEIAVQKAIELGSTEIVILGAFGGRMDHCIANIHLLKMVLEAGVECHLIDEQNDICLIDDSYELRKEEQYGKYVSFLPFTDEVEGITLKGFKYPVNNFMLKKGPSRGVSNEIQDEVGRVSLTKGILLMIQSRD